MGIFLNFTCPPRVFSRTMSSRRNLSFLMEGCGFSSNARDARHPAAVVFIETLLLEKKFNVNIKKGEKPVNNIVRRNSSRNRSGEGAFAQPEIDARHDS